MGFRFEHPHWLAFLIAVPALAAFLGWSRWRKGRLLARFAGASTLARLLPSVSRAKQTLKSSLLLAACAFAIFSLSRPQYGVSEQPIQRKGVDLFIAIDTSESMLAQDIKPNRLARAKEQLKGMIRKLKGDRVGIIAFAGEAFVQCPLTLDYGLAERQLDAVGPDSVPVKGTAIGEAVRTAAQNFERNELGHKVLVLLTDGEDQGSKPLDAAKEAAKQGIVVYAVGIGSEKGAPIPIARGGLKSDREGHAVNSRLDFETLTKIAVATGGSAVLARESGFMELDAIYNEIQSLDQKLLTSTMHSLFRERYGWFLAPAILLLVAEMLITDRRGRRRAAERISGE